MPGGTGTEQREVESLPVHVHGQAVVERRQGAAHITHVGIHRRLGETAVLVIVVGLAVLANAGVLVTPEEPHRITFLEPGGELHVTEAGTGLVTHGGLQVGDLVLQGGQVAVDAVVEVADLVLPAQLELPTGVVHRAGVHRGAADTHLGHRGDAHEQVAGVLVEPVHPEGQAVVEQTQVHTEVRLHGGFPGEVRIRETVRLRTQGERVVLAELIALAVVGNGGGIRIAGKHGDVTVDTPGGAELQKVQDVAADVVLDEAFVADGPAHGNGREVAPAVLQGEL